MGFEILYRIEVLIFKEQESRGLDRVRKQVLSEASQFSYDQQCC